MMYLLAAPRRAPLTFSVLRSRRLQEQRHQMSIYRLLVRACNSALFRHQTLQLAIKQRLPLQVVPLLAPVALTLLVDQLLKELQ